MKFTDRLKTMLRSFMAGRNGVDKLSNTLLWAGRGAIGRRDAFQQLCFKHSGHRHLSCGHPAHFLTQYRKAQRGEPVISSRKQATCKKRSRTGATALKTANSTVTSNAPSANPGFACRAMPER